MPLCTCSARIIELFVKDLAGINLRRPLPRPHIISYQRRRNFGAISQLRSLDRAAASGLDDGFVPFDFEVKAESSVTASKPDNVPKKQLKANHTGKDELDAEWHAEIQIVAPWPQETNSSHASNTEVFQGTQEETVDNQLKGPEHSSLLASKGTRLVDQTSIQNLDNQQDTGEMTAQVPLLPPEPTLEPSSAPQRSRLENRQERKLRRLQAGTYRREAETRLKERLADTQMSSVLSNIEAMEGPDAGEGGGSPKGNVEKETKKSNSKVAGRESAHSHVIQKAPTKKENGTKSKAEPSGADVVKSVKLRQKTKKEAWKVQKEALREKFGERGWQPRKRLSPDTLDGIRALHTSNPGSYTTQTLAEHFEITPEAIRRILKSKWRPNTDEVEKRRTRWEKRGERKWKAMAEQGTRPPAKWRAKGIRTPQAEKKRPSRRKDEEYVEWKDRPRGGPSLSGRIL